MRFTARKAVSPIIATLLLIAIAVAAGIIVYVFVNSISGNLTQQGGQQVSEQISMDAYTFPSAGTAPVMTLRNVGSSAVSIGQIYFDGTLCQATTFLCSFTTITTTGGCTTAVANTVPVVCGTGTYTSITLALSTAQTVGTSHLIRCVTSDGGTFTFTVIAGRSG
jgi:flagellin-like protein